MRIPALTKTVLPVAALATALAVVPAAPASAKTLTCKKHSTELIRKSGSTLWLSANKKLLYACTSFYETAPHDTKLGPWGPGSQFAFDGSSAVWTVRSGGKDKLWSGDGSSQYSDPAWLRGVAPVVGHGSNTDTAVVALKVWGQSVAWVTSKSTVGMAVQSPEDDPSLIGKGTPGAAAPAGATPLAGQPLGLVADPPKAKNRRIVLGRWPGIDPATLGSTLKLVDGSGGDGDECGGVTEYKGTVVPVAGQPAVGLDWYSSWSSTSGPCA